MRRLLFGAFFAALIASASTDGSMAADYAVRYQHRQSSSYIDRGPNPYCGPRCGCPVTAYVRHRSLVQYYPSGFDPRTRGEPSFAYGPVRTYARYASASCPEQAMLY